MIIGQLSHDCGRGHGRGHGHSRGHGRSHSGGHPLTPSPLYSGDIIDPLLQAKVSYWK